MQVALRNASSVEVCMKLSLFGVLISDNLLFSSSYLMKFHFVVDLPSQLPRITLSLKGYDPRISNLIGLEIMDYTIRWYFGLQNVVYYE